MSDPLTAYEQIVAPLEDRMKRSVWRITRNSQDAEDALQNALLTIWKRWNRITAHGTPSALVLKICIDSAYDVLRRRIRQQRRREPAVSAHLALDGAGEPHNELASHERSVEVQEAMQRLSRGQATAMALRIFEDLPYEEIAAAMGCTAATARKHVQRGRERLRTLLAQHEPIRTSGRTP